MSDKVPLSAFVLSDEDYSEARRSLFTDDGSENFAVCFCGMAREDGWKRFLVREFWPAPSDAYQERLPYHLEIAPAFFNKVIDHCLRTKLVPVVCHSHPGGKRARYSPSDNHGESRLLKVFSDLLPASVPGSLLFTPSDVAGRFHEHGRLIDVGQVEIRGLESRNYARVASANGAEADGSFFDRQVRAIGQEGQNTVGNLRIGIVGVGGTGSAVAEELVRLGVSDLTVVDPDSLESSNLSRVWGSHERDISSASLKVAVIAKHLGQIRSGVKVRVIPDSVIRQSVLMKLRDRDLIFSCTDNHLSRAVVNRFAHQYLIPVVDMGIRIDARPGRVTAVAGRVSLVGIGLVCLRCSGHFDPDLVRAESLPESERRSLAKEGYVQGIADPAPAVISLNTTVASLAVTAGIGLFVNLVGRKPALDQLYDATSGTMFTASARHEATCDVCAPSEGLKALGDLQVVSAYD